MQEVTPSKKAADAMASTPEVNTPSFGTPGVDDLDVATGEDDDDDFEGLEDYLKSLE